MNNPPGTRSPDDVDDDTDTGIDSDVVGFDSVYEAELTSLVRLATLLLGSQALGEEAVQDAFVQLHRTWESVRNPGGFVRTATVNRCRDIQRRQSRADRYLRSVQLGQGAGLNGTGLNGAAQNGTEQHYLIDALQELSDIRRAVLVLRFYGNYKLREISELLHVPEGTVRSNLSRGLNELREVLR